MNERDLERAVASEDFQTLRRDLQLALVAQSPTTPFVLLAAMFEVFGDVLEQIVTTFPEALPSVLGMCERSTTQWQERALAAGGERAKH